MGGPPGNGFWGVFRNKVYDGKRTPRNHLVFHVLRVVRFSGIALGLVTAVVSQPFVAGVILYRFCFCEVDYGGWFYVG